jgi:hypothetical protein
VSLLAAVRACDNSGIVNASHSQFRWPGFTTYLSPWGGSRLVIKTCTPLRYMLGDKPRNFVRTKLRPPGYPCIIAKAAIMHPRNCHRQFRGLRLSCRCARDSGGAIAPATIHTYRKATVFGRIVAESPQDLHWQIRGLAAESPVFLPGCGQKNAPKFLEKIS